MVWSHDWQRPVGKGRIEVKADRAVFAGKFNLATSWGRDAYESVKDMADLQEYSYGYAPIDAEPGVVHGQSVRILKALKACEVSPVLVGAGRDTGTESIKQAEADQPETFVAHGDRVLVVVRDYLARAQTIGRMRAEEQSKAGLVLTKSNRDRIAALLEALGAVRGEW